MKSVFVYDWHIDRVETSERKLQTIIRGFGLTPDNATVDIICTDCPYTCMVEVDDPRKINQIQGLSKVNYTIISKEYKKPLYYTSTKVKPYVEVEFKNKEDLDMFCSRVRNKYRIHEHNAPLTLQLVSKQELPICGWIDIYNCKTIPKYDSPTLTDETYQCSYLDMKASDRVDIVCPLILSFDIEVYSSCPRKMPNPSTKEDRIFQISMVFWRYKGESKRYLLTLGTPTVRDDGIILEMCKTEQRMLNRFTELINLLNPHVIIGYNIMGFDFPYMFDRATTLGIQDFQYMSFLKGHQCEIVEDNWSSSAYGKQILKYPVAPGRIILDMLIHVKRNKALDNYKLDTVAQKFLGAKKDPLTVQDIFKAYRVGMERTEEGNHLLGICGQYCVKDSDLVVDLFKYFDVWLGVTEMSNVCNVPISKLYTKGQQFRVFSQVYKYCKKNNIVVEHDVFKAQDDDKYQGAKVLDPVPGLYENVIPFDFKSLYPSIIIAYNIDYSTLVLNDDTVLDSECNVIEWTEEDVKYRYRFLKEPRGVLPTIIKNLLDARETTRSHMKTIEDKALKGVLDSRQLAYKVSANSMYGALGVHRGYLPCMPAAMCVTALGRENLQKAINHLKDEHKAVIVYGDTDSNYVQFPHVKPCDLWEHSVKVAKYIKDNCIFPPPMELEFEKVIYGKFLILTKKRYMWRYLKDGVLKPEIGKKGVLLARRDNALFVRTIYEKVVDYIFNDASKNQILDYICDEIEKCYTFQYTNQEFIITKSIGDTVDYKIKDLPEDEQKRTKRLYDLHCTEDDYNSRALPAHIQLAERMRARGTRVDIGERLEYVITGNPLKKLFDKVEDPTYQAQHKRVLPIDYTYYIKNLSKPIDDLLDIVFPNESLQAITKQYKMKLLKYKLLREFKTFIHPLKLI
jgi:DNA polymerase elongation subunit (family B)